MIEFELEMSTGEVLKKTFDKNEDVFNYIEEVNSIIQSYNFISKHLKKTIERKLFHYKDFYNLFGCTAKEVLYTSIADSEKGHATISIKLFHDGQYVKKFWHGDDYSIDNLQAELFRRTDII